MLDIKDALRVEKYYPPNGNGGSKNVFIFKCDSCDNEIKIKARSRLKTATGLCVKCNNQRMHPKALIARRIRKYESCYNILKSNHKKRNIEINLTYEEFLTFITINQCTYCNKDINWKPHGNHNYYLDRKDNNKGYSLENCVVCCAKCNKGKREIYTYEEWYGMTKYFRDL